MKTPNTYQAPVGQVRRHPLCVPSGDAAHVATGVAADSPSSGFVSVSQVRGALCTKPGGVQSRRDRCRVSVPTMPVRLGADTLAQR